MSKRNKIIYWVATVWLALGMVSTGIVQLTGLKTGAGGADSLSGLGYPLYLMPLLGAAKMTGAAVILIPKRSLLKEWAYAGFFFMMGGAVYSHIASGAPGALFPALLLLILTMISWYFRPADRKFIPLSQQ